MAQRRVTLSNTSAKPQFHGHARASRRSARRPPRASPPPC
jgi:hypothetical protein